ncbi:MAG: ABC transporter permease [Bacteroidales bacterium]|nr:ABC transporter permease [Bacteroidales bacterium]
MFDLDRYKEIWQSISRNKSRSLLTAFGVFWGMFMFVVLLGIGKGFHSGFVAGIQNMPKNSTFIFSDRTSVAYKGFNAGRYWSLTNEDIEIVKKNIPEVQYVSGLNGNDNKTVTYNEKSLSFSVMGTGEDYFNIDKQTLVKGRVFNPIDIREKRKVCILGQNVYSQIFFNEEEPIGKQISIDGIYYIVIGIVKASGYVNIGGNASESIYIPMTTLQQVENYGNSISLITIAAYDDADIAVVEDKIKSIIKQKHTIAPEDDLAVSSFNMKEVLKSFDMLFLGINFLIWLVGIGTLLAGVIGISNIMLVSVRERTKEIGVKRAIGAKPLSIIRQITGESVTLTSIAGIFGLFLGVLALSVVDNMTAAKAASGDIMFQSPQISFWMGITALIIIIVFGMMAGIIPAKKALEIKAIDALRDE